MKMSNNIWNAEDDLKSNLGFVSGLDAWNLSDVLVRANRKVTSRFGNRVEQRLYADFGKQRVYDINFFDVIKKEGFNVFLNDLLVSDDDYEIEYDIGRIIFTESFANKNFSEFTRFRLRVDYLPMIYRTLELYYAMNEVLASVVVQLNDSENNVRYKNIKEQIKETETAILDNMPSPDYDKGVGMANRDVRSGQKYNV